MKQGCPSYEEMMAAGRDAILVVIEPIHERLDRDGKNVGGADQFAPSPGANVAHEAAFLRADDGTKLIGIQQRAIRNLSHHLIEIDMASDVCCHAEALDEQRDPAAIRMAAWNRLEILRLVRWRSCVTTALTQSESVRRRNGLA